MKFGWLIEYNMKNVVFERSYTECCKETSPFSEISPAFYIVFLLSATLRAIEIY